MMESLGVLSFFVAFLFFRQYRRISGREREFLDALNRKQLSENGSGKCFSSEWVFDNIVFKPKKLLNATPLFMGVATILLVVFYYLVGPMLVSYILSLGYASVIVLVGVGVLLWTDAFEAFGYTTAFNKVSIERLDKEDRSYIELARESLEKAFLRFVSLGIAFVVFGPFIPQIFNGFVYAFTVYTTVFFEASQVSFKVFTALGMGVVLVLPVLMLFLPEILGRIMIRKGKSLTRRIFRRENRQ